MWAVLQVIHTGAALMICIQTRTCLAKGISQLTRKAIDGGRQCRPFIVQEAASAMAELTWRRWV